MFDDEVVHRVELPVSELRGHLDHRARYIPDSTRALLLSIVGAYTAAALVVFLIMHYTVGVPIVSIMFGGLGGLVGAPVGWLGYLKWGPKPFYNLKRRLVEREQVNEATGEAETVRGYLSQPIVHSRFTDDEWIQDGGGVVPRVFRSTAFFEMTQAHDAQDKFRDPSRHKFEKLEVGMMAVTTICLAVLTILFVIAMAG